MDNVFEVHRFDRNTLIIGLGKAYEDFDIEEIQEMHKKFQEALPNINIITTFGIEGIYMIKETI